MLACVRNSGNLDALLPVCARLTPRIERHPDALVLDLGGCERLVLGHETAPSFRSTPVSAFATCTWPALAASLWRQVRDARSSADSLCVGLGPTRTVAWLAAAIAPTRPDSWCAIGPGQVAVFLHPLPIGALLTVPDLSGMSGAAEMLEALAQGGVQTVGQVAGLGAMALHRRFGPLGTRLATLAAGQDVTPLHPWTPPTSLGARIGLDPPVTVDQLAPILTLLADQLAAALQRRHLGAGAVALVLHGADGATWRATRPLGQPTASPLALGDQAQRLLAMRTQDKAGEMTCSAVHLRVGRLRPLPARQDLLWPSQAEREGQARRARLLAPDGPLAGRQGAAAVLRAALVAPDAVLPEQRYTFVPLHPLHQVAA